MGQKLYPTELRADGIYVGLEPAKPACATISDVMVETMVNWGVRSVFGMVGHSNLGLAEALRLQEMAGQLRYYGIRHEGAASFACSGYAKVSGKPAACLSIAGPGATNLLTGLFDAKVDRAPVLALTGQVDIQVLGPGTFPGARSCCSLRAGGPLQPERAADLPPCGTHVACLQERHRRAQCFASDLSGRCADSAGQAIDEGRDAGGADRPRRYRAVRCRHRARRSP